MKRKALLLLSLLIATGCGKTTFHGKVTFKGRPVVSGMVVALNPDGGATVKGTIEPDGTYVVHGVRRGRVKFGVLSPDPTPSAKTKPAEWFPLPRTLGSPGTSGLECDATSSTVYYDLDAK